MTFNIFVPDDEVNKQRCEPFPTLYYLAGLSATQDSGPWKTGFAAHASKHRIAIVFPDVSPRNIDNY
jgi:S-formylglutathione hydrolase